VGAGAAFETASPTGWQPLTVRHRVAGAAAGLGWISLCLLPISLGFGRFWAIHIAPSSNVAYQYRSVAIYPADAVVALTCFGWLSWRLLSDRHTRLSSSNWPVLAGIAALTVAAVASAGAASDRLLAIGLSLELALLGVFFLAASDLLTRFSRWPLLAGIAVAVIAQAALAALQAITQSTAPTGFIFNGWPREATAHGRDAAVVMLPIAGRWLRAYGSFAHPNILGGFLAVALAVIAIAYDGRARRWLRWAMVAGFVGLLLTFSRTAILALLIGGAVFGLSRWPGARRMAISRRAVAVVLTASALLALVAIVRVGNLGTLVERNSIETRLSSYSVTWKLIETEGPVGAGNHVLVEQQRYGGGGPAHDVFLIALAELGLLGLLAWLSIFVGLLYVGWRRRTAPRARAGPLIAAGVLLPLLLFDHYLWTLAPGRVLFVWALATLTGIRVGRGAIAADVPDPVWSYRAKRVVDVIVATMSLVAALPVFAVVSCLIWIDSGGPIFFQARRLGDGGRSFTMYKFRTMAVGAEEALIDLRARNVADGMVKILDDPRVTPVGRWLRRYSLDELPQLWNVIRGDMSLVGPRPHQVGEVSPIDDRTLERLSVRPGLTGLWQVRARTNPSLEVRERYDLEYISTWSLRMDVSIILATIPMVLRGNGGEVSLSDPHSAEGHIYIGIG
jgi:lipopolysaccharide/colanic/teichoic acid biosynthesis glycosyltransferase/O-antigen ligase